MRAGQLLIAAIGLALTIPVIASAADFAEDFDAYPTGTSMHGVNGWKGWDNNPAFTAFTTDVQALSGPNSVAIAPTSDLVHEFTGATSGTWHVIAWQYIPSSLNGAQYLLLLNTYNDGGPYNWSTQLRFQDGVVTNDGDATTFPILFDEWVEIRVEINLDADLQSIYYAGSFLTQTSWTEGVSGAGVLNIGAIDLYSAGASDIYYDDILVEEQGATPVIESSWGSIKSTFKN
jgi:hypothetical protein